MHGTNSAQDNPLKAQPYFPNQDGSADLYFNLRISPAAVVEGSDDWRNPLTTADLPLEGEMAGRPEGGAKGRRPIRQVPSKGTQVQAFQVPKAPVLSLAGQAWILGSSPLVSG